MKKSYTRSGGFCRGFNSLSAGDLFSAFLHQLLGNKSTHIWAVTILVWLGNLAANTSYSEEVKAQKSLEQEKVAGISRAQNRMVPPHSEPSATISFPETPSSDDFRQVRLFAEPLIPVGDTPSASQNRELATAISIYSERTVPDDYSSLELFVTKYPDSPWAPSLLFDLGMEYYSTAWYSKALVAFEKAWLLFKKSNDTTIKPLADRSAGELAYMYARLGRMADLENILHSIKDRPLVGLGSEKIAGAQQGLWTMQNRPEIAFCCGPLALSCILSHYDISNSVNPLIRNAQSTTNGFTLTQVAALSRKLGMNYQMAYRSNGAPFLAPAVVNWKVGHYAALIREENGRFLLQDHTFRNDTVASRGALESESSGYFLVPSGALPKGWRTVSDTEGDRVTGKGYVSGNDQDCTGCNEASAFQQCSSCGGDGGYDDAGGDTGTGDGTGGFIGNDWTPSGDDGFSGDLWQMSSADARQELWSSCARWATIEPRIQIL